MFNLNGCTNNQKVSCFGSKADIYLEKGKKLVTVTWRNNSLWIVTKPMKNTDSTEIYTVEEKSSLGVLEVYYTIHEVK